MTKSGLGFEQELQSANKELSRIREQIKKQADIINRAAKEKDRLCELERKSQKRILVIIEQGIVHAGLDNSIIKTVRALKEISGELKRDDITIARQKALREEENVAKKLLRHTCTHNFVLSYDGYAGSYSHDHDDAYYGMRKCVICEETELSQSTTEEKYNILANKEGRLIKRDIRHTDKNHYHPEKKDYETLEYYLEAFRRSAGDKNICWPVMKDGQMTEQSDYFLRTP